MNYTIENDYLSITVKDKGAELTSLFSRVNQKEYLYQVQEGFWNKQSPVLFPFIGALKDDQYSYQGQTYSMTKHGFARDHIFELADKSINRLDFVLSSQTIKLENYPFDYEFHIIYHLIKDTLVVKYKVVAGDNDLYFTVGGHPAFNVPLAKGLSFEDYFVEIKTAGPIDRYPLNGAYIDQSLIIRDAPKQIALKHDLFTNDLLLYKTPNATKISIRSEKDSSGVALTYSSIPYVGLWTLTNQAPFLCIEPWTGLPDDINSNGQLQDKLGIQHLEAGKEFIMDYTIEVF